MSTTPISALPSIGTIDPASDLIPIVDVSLGVTDSTTPNHLFGITGSVVGTSDSQTLSNKTLDNTNTLTIKDTNLIIQDDGDVTKQAKFQTSGISTSTTRTYSLPNISDTLTANTASQTLTNKTLTAPVISGGTIDNATITVDSISGHSTSTIVAVGGVQMNNGIIGTTGAVVTNSIAAGAVVPNSLEASTGTGWAFQPWTPTWSNMSVGNATVISTYSQVGKVVFCQVKVTFGTTTTIAGNPTFTLPVTAATSLQGPLGMGVMTAAAAAATFGFFSIISTTQANFQLGNSATAYLQPTNDLSATVPGTWAVGSIWGGQFWYEAA